MHHPRWFLYGLFDGPIVGGAVAGLSTLMFGVVDVVAGLPGEGWGLFWRAIATGLYGALAGLIVGILCGMAIDLLRQFGLRDSTAVWDVMAPVLGGGLILGVAFLPVGAWLALPLAAVVADLCWRLSRLDRQPHGDSVIAPGEDG